MRWLWLIVTLLVFMNPALALQHSEGGAADTISHPVLPPAAPWHGVVVVLVLGMFVLAAAVGVVVRANIPEDITPVHSHDEPPGATGHHGHSGMIQQPPHDVHETEKGHH